ncbi:hypothetical protein Tco_0624708 [Tanacetum coccineum]|uniref:Retrotransposon gag domain-containing protein n=1 Tax=Tanacetum coccineum TaxID=301880 RepID=A0ABQ4WEP2_9ASTR
MPPRRPSIAKRALVARRALSARTANNPARNASTTTDAPMSVDVINQQIETRVAEALANQEQLRNNSVNGDGSQNSRSGTERPTRTPRECTFKDFLNCQPLTFKGTEGVVGLTQWFEKMESVFHISNCTIENQVKFSTCTFLDATLTWWNSHVKTVETSIDVRDDVFEESDEVEKYVDGLPDMIQAENKRKFDNNNQAQQQLPKRQNVAQAYAARTGERKEYAGTLPLYNKCKFHHNGSCTVKNQGHYKSDCPELRNRNHGNQTEDTKAHGVVYALGGEETDQYPNNIEDDIGAQEEDFLASTSEP